MYFLCFFKWGCFNFFVCYLFKLENLWLHINYYILIGFRFFFTFLLSLLHFSLCYWLFALAKFFYDYISITIGFCCFFFSFFIFGFGWVLFCWDIVVLLTLYWWNEFFFYLWTCCRRKYMSCFWVLQKLVLLLWDLKGVIHWWVFIWNCLCNTNTSGWKYVRVSDIDTHTTETPFVISFTLQVLFSQIITSVYLPVFVSYLVSGVHCLALFSVGYWWRIRV